MTDQQIHAFTKHKCLVAAQNATNIIRYKRWLRLWKRGTDITLRIPGLIPEHDL